MSQEMDKGAATAPHQQRTKITAVVMQDKIALIQLNVPVRVGIRVPDSVHLYPLPQELFVNDAATTTSWWATRSS
jgi:hypothetical protein